METFRITAVDELSLVAKRVLEVAKAREDGSVVLALSGDLGAGKTTFTQILASTLGVKEPVTSPTFTIMKYFELEDQEFDSLVHIDAYRLDAPEELAVLGFASLLATPRTLIVIEWAEKVASLLPPKTISLSFAIEGEQRVINLKHD